MRLRDGRMLAWRQYGDNSGVPIIFCHGNLNSRLFEPAWSATQELTAAARARVIAVDRPGYGGSDFLSGRVYMSWPNDVAQLVEHLQLGAYAVLGFSSGGPNAMAIAAAASTKTESHRSSGRPAACGLISPDGPYRQIGGDEMVEAMYGTRERTLATFAARTERAHANMRASYEGMKKADRREVALRDLEEAVRQGLDKGAAQDGLLESGEWGFDLNEIDTGLVPTFLWHGKDDHNVPIAVGQYVADRIEGCNATFIPGENHSLLRRHWQPILERLVSAVHTARAAVPGAGSRAAAEAGAGVGGSCRSQL